MIVPRIHVLSDLQVASQPTVTVSPRVRPRYRESGGNEIAGRQRGGRNDDDDGPQTDAATTEQLLSAESDGRDGRTESERGKEDSNKPKRLTTAKRGRERDIDRSGFG